MPATLVLTLKLLAVRAVYLEYGSLLLLFLARSQDRGDVYNILWVLVFGFATLNILGLVAKRFESERSRLSFGEFLAIMVVLVAIVLLAWELLTLFKVFPIRLRPR
ncbi:MAG TPA: hypothetical protein VH744_08930 [Terriglobales bacterium]